MNYDLMSIATQNVKLEHFDNQNLPSSLNNLSMVNQVNTMEIEEDDDEDDVDFNPTWRGESPSEASSGLSSDNEVLGDDVGEVLSCLSKHQCDGTSPMAFCNNLDSGAEDEENVMQNNLQVQNAPKTDSTSVITEVKELKRLIQQEEESTSPEGTNNKVASINENDATEEVAKKEFTVQAESYLDPNSFTEPVTETDDEDAICKRTRARHSLKNYTLEELEAFLQESDDDDDLQNVDEEKEYRKFLAAVLLGGDGTGGAGEDDNFDDDEENDADFAIEIEEALESDVDESFDDDKRPSDRNEDDVYRPETRQNKRLRESTEKKKCFTRLGKMPLRPILPYVSNGQAAPVPVLGLHFPSPERFSCCSFSLPGADVTPGFTFQQLGQLFCLLHEHAQLLIQIFSISILDPSRQQVAMEVQELIMEMVAKHEDALARRRIPYNMPCFQPSNLRSSLHIDSSESSEFSHWTPLIDGSIFSIMDVAPLRMVKSYMADVSAVVSRHRQIQMEDQLDKSHLNKEPLFPFPAVPAQMVTDELSLGDAVSVSSKIASPLSPGQLPTRKSLAATLVENTKKQTVALVPMDIAKLAQRFYPLFNLALFPHKPPVPAVANRVLFTDAEDGLLAMGVMKYNSDWEAIQKHFLPCKSKHQIFVRQKNRSSSKAPDNPIKAVRRMKTSPLTADEKARICEGLKLFKQDWLSVWKFFIPHRDPSLLPRQWRIATGTQKSYRKSEAIKEKRRLYEARRRRLKASMNDSNTVTEKEVDNEGDDSGEYIDNEDEAYVHEAFLADSETGSTNSASYEISLSGICSSSIQFANMMLYDGTYASGRSASSSECIHAEKSTVMHELANLRKPARNMNPLSHCTDIRNNSQNILQSNYHSSISSLRAPGSHLGSLPGPTRRSKGTRVVKLAPGLPPINLPPSVRVISQSALQNHPNRSSPSYMSKNGNRNPSKFPGVAKGEISALPGGNSTMLLSDGLEARRQQDEAPTDQYVDDENGSQSDLQMHPLLFHASEDQFSSYYSMNRYTTVSSTYLLGSELQKEAIVSKSDATVTLKDSINGIRNLSEAPLDLFSAGFHPLLRRTDNAGADFGMSSVNRRSGHPAASHHDKLSQESQCLPRENVAVDSQFPARVSTCHYDKENKLDLDIHLYSATEKEKTRKTNDPTRLQCNGTDSPRLQTTMVEEGIDVDISIYLCNKNCSEVSASCGEDSNMLETAKMSDIGPSQCTRDYDESNLDIIMEQEELSDSDDESANVEFECEEIDDSEEDDSEYSRPKESLNKELPAASVRENNQDSCNLNHSRQPMSIRRELVHEDRNLTRQNLFHTKQSQSKPKHDNLKRDILSTSSPTAAESQFSKARNPKSSKMQPSGAKQYLGQPGNDCSKTVASRKPRKRSACK